MKLRFILLFISFSVCLFGQATFQKELSFSLAKPFVKKAADNQSIFVSGVESAKIQVINIDAATGNLLWRKTFLSDLAQPILRDVVVQKDGIVLAIAEGTSSHNAFLVKIDLQGNLLWNRHVGATNWTDMFDIEEDDQENIWIAALAFAQTSSDTSFYYTTQMRKDGTFELGKKFKYRYNQFFQTDYISKVHQLNWNPKDKTMWSLADETAPYAQTGTFIGGGSGGALHNATFAKFESFDKYEYRIVPIDMEQIMLTPEGNLAVTGQVQVVGNVNYYPAIAYYDTKKGNFYGLKETPKIIKILATFLGGTLIYNEKDNSISKLDAKMDVIWKKRMDKCSETNNVEAVIMPNGDIFIIRNIGESTVLAKIDANGNTQNCFTTTLKNENFESKSDIITIAYNNYPLFYDIKIGAKAEKLDKGVSTLQLKDFCASADATFVLPDTVCLGATYLPTKVDTSKFLIHIWNIPNKGLDDPIPSLVFSKVGWAKIKHSAKVGVCSDTLSKRVWVIDAPVLTLRDTVVCGKNNLQINLSNPKATDYFMNGKSINPNITILQSGIYNFKIKNKSCADSAKIKVKIVDFAEPITLPSPLCGKEIFGVALKDFNNIFWDNKPLLKDTFFILDILPHTYKATYTKDSDCKIQGTFTVPRKKCDGDDKEIIYVPNIFSPNDDNQNDILQPFGKDILVMSMEIYDRWGNHIFKAEGADASWNGRYKNYPAQSGVYVYVVRYTDLRTGEEKIKKGDVFLAL